MKVGPGEDHDLTETEMAVVTVVSVETEGDAIGHTLRIVAIVVKKEMKEVNTAPPLMVAKRLS